VPEKGNKIEDENVRKIGGKIYGFGYDCCLFTVNWSFGQIPVAQLALLQLGPAPFHVGAEPHGGGLLGLAKFPAGLQPDANPIPHQTDTPWQTDVPAKEANQGNYSAKENWNGLEIGTFTQCHPPLKSLN
jgi:hypothetical protein